MDFSSCIDKQTDLCRIFSKSSSQDEIYKTLISLKNRLPSFEKNKACDNNLVRGCQSNLWIYSKMENGKVLFFSKADALISAGISALFVLSYSDELPETILGCPPMFFDKLNLNNLLSPGRSNGALSLHLRMKQLVLPYLSFSKNIY
ncbi:MAG: SufE family protein [Victivallaceae bacterium]